MSPWNSVRLAAGCTIVAWAREISFAFCAVSQRVFCITEGHAKTKTNKADHSSQVAGKQMLLAFSRTRIKNHGTGLPFAMKT
jgi:hypothetical protein